MWANGLRLLSSRNLPSRVSLRGHTNAARNIFRLLSTAGNSYDAIILVNLQDFLRECAHNTEFQKARIGTKQSSTFSRKKKQEDSDTLRFRR